MARKDVRFPEKVIDESGRCVVESDGQRCCFPGSLSESTHGGEWTCRLHWKCPPGMVIPVIEESKIWFELSRKGHEVPATYKRFDGADLPGFRTRTFRKAA